MHYIEIKWAFMTGFSCCVGFSITEPFSDWRDRKAEPAGVQTHVEKDQGVAGGAVLATWTPARIQHTYKFSSDCLCPCVFSADL